MIVVIKQIAIDDAWKMLSTNQGTVLIDVRTESEWCEGIPDMGDIGKEVKLITISNDSEAFEYKLRNAVSIQEAGLIFICRSGVRSDIAAKIAKSLGYLDSYNLVGGFQEWKKHGLAYKKWRSK